MKKFHSYFIEIIDKFTNSYTLISLLIAYEKFIIIKDKLSLKVDERAKALIKRDKGTAILKN